MVVHGAEVCTVVCAGGSAWLARSPQKEHACTVAEAAEIVHGTLQCMRDGLPVMRSTQSPSRSRKTFCRTFVDFLERGFAAAEQQQKQHKQEPVPS